MLRSALLFSLLLLALPVYAENAEDARKELSTTLSALKQSNAKQKELAQKTETLQAELKKLQEEMVEMAHDAKGEEEDLSSSEDQLGALESQKKQKIAAFDARQAELSTMISAMMKLRQLPPEAVIAMPGKLEETLETSRALGIITHAIEEESITLKVQLHELDALEDKIRHGRETVASHKTSLATKQAELGGKIKERSELVEKLGGQEKEEREHIAALTAKSQTLQELVDSLQKSETGTSLRKQESESAAHAAPREAGHKLRSFANARGRIRLPAAGRITSHFGNTEGSETFSKGILIDTRDDADVVAPFDGEVVFAGPFRDYGRIVIIRHSGDYHTLISGMEEIDCKPGQYLLEGEPIGSMGSGAGATRLYMELREDGKPIDPGPWVKG